MMVTWNEGGVDGIVERLEHTHRHTHTHTRSSGGVRGEVMGSSSAFTSLSQGHDLSVNGLMTGSRVCVCVCLIGDIA